MTTETATREHPILFSSEMIRAIMRERNPKTMTRRLVKMGGIATVVGRNGNGELDPDAPREIPEWQIERLIERCPHGQPGGQLWVKETWALVRPWSDEDGYVDEVEEWKGPLPPRLPETWRIWYAADGDDIKAHPDDRLVKRWRPSIFMPRWASRITLEIAGVRIERLQEISHEDAIAEGCQGTDWVSSSPCIVGPHTDAGELPVEEFERLWDLLNSKRAAWESSPFCWVISFKRIKP